MKISKIVLYDEPTVPEIQLEKIREFISNALNIEVEVKGNFFESIDHDMCKKIATTRIFDLKNPFKVHTPSTEEIQIETQNKDMSNRKEMTLYDGFELQNIISKHIPSIENTLHIILTNKLTATFDQNDFRYHARSLISSNPTIISTAGIIEAPAKPKQYYLDLMTNFSENRVEEVMKKYKGEFLEYHDPRLYEILEGYVLQAILYYKTGEAFCDKKECRLFNAHWQKDLFYSQIENKKICKHHQEIINDFNN
ncbi:DUF6775 family putative metallopeptidase [Candidatus Nitrosopumilus sediminis]|uniref:Uncharacterized protein n=1 Tax=Candidatus Nitrosopumilus sediminis TaxID=1229909 RepID=K0BBX9_9ARCH|nr:DUF6775 family putative metallopeptidase [Candidatus Nitrosopumilus sediminis]AFS82495.1 hypothetical protein NSED_03445 [Candidatus Nitrosopumilus sediminis]